MSYGSYCINNFNALSVVKSKDILHVERDPHGLRSRQGQLVTSSLGIKIISFRQKHESTVICLKKSTHSFFS